MCILYCMSEHHMHSESVDKKYLAIAFYAIDGRNWATERQKCFQLRGNLVGLIMEEGFFSVYTMQGGQKNQTKYGLRKYQIWWPFVRKLCKCDEWGSGGSRGGARLPFIFKPNWSPKGQKSFFGRLPPKGLLSSNRLELSPRSFTHVFKKIETTMRWHCMSKALRFLHTDNSWISRL